MGIVLGFGSQEEKARKEIRDIVSKALSEGKDVDALSKELRDRNSEYDKMSKEDAPERYTNFYCYDNKIHFHHINRRHAFSPDGWALLCVEEPMPKLEVTHAAH